MFALIEQVFFRSLAGLLAENLALRHRLSVLERVTKRPRPQGLGRDLPGVAVTDRPGLAALARDGQGPERLQVAPRGLSLLLSLEVAIEGRLPTNAAGRVGAYPSHVV